MKKHIQQTINSLYDADLDDREAEELSDALRAYQQRRRSDRRHQNLSAVPGDKFTLGPMRPKHLTGAPVEFVSAVYGGRKPKARVMMLDTRYGSTSRSRAFYETDVITVPLDCLHPTS